MRILNIGILAHIDAGKTSLTERLLYDTGAIDRLGAVDAGDTQTDTDEIERRRGITIRAAVAPFTTEDLQVNVVDTPGHPDFIAEVDRALTVLDGAILVVSAVEGVQPQTRVLYRALRERQLPTLVFVNKVDRAGARVDGVLAELRGRLGARMVPMTEVRSSGDASARCEERSLTDARHREAVAEVLAEQDEGLLADLVGDPLPSVETVRTALLEQVRSARLHPVYAGSAMTGQGVAELLDGIRRLLPVARTDQPGPRGTVFAVERGPGSGGGAGQKVAYVRMHAGQIATRQRITLERPEPEGGASEHVGRITWLRVARVCAGAVPGASWVSTGRVSAGDIARVGGLAAVRVGDRIGSVDVGGDRSAFPPPRLETAVRPRRPEDPRALHAALLSLSDQDPLIRARVLPDGGTSVLLHGEVQKEVIAARLLEEFGIRADFEPTRAVYLERVVGSGEAHEEMGGWHRQVASVGLRVDPAAPGTGLDYRLAVELGSLPAGFHRAVRETVARSLEQGLFGWPVPDCTVVLTRSGYSSAGSTAGDFRRLTPLVLMEALRQAGTRVHEPLDAFEVTAPTESVSVLSSRLSALGAEVGTPVTEPNGDGGSSVLRGAIPTRHVDQVRQVLPGLTRGEGVWWSWPGGDRPARRAAPRRERTDGNPLDPTEYLRSLALGKRGQSR